MNFIDGISRKIGLLNNEDEDIQDTAEEEKVEPKKAEKKAEPTVMPAFGAIETPIAPPIDNFVGHNVVDFNSAMAARESAATMTKSKINTIRPKSFDDAQIVANCLRDKVPVIINFEQTDVEDARRIIDFISGTTYALHGEIKQVSQYVFVCAPNNVTVTYTEDEKKATSDIPWLTK